MNNPHPGARERLPSRPTNRRILLSAILICSPRQLLLVVLRTRTVARVDSDSLSKGLFPNSARLSALHQNEKYYYKHHAGNNSNERYAVHISPFFSLLESTAQNLP
jgi:hypothetical protein